MYSIDSFKALNMKCLRCGERAFKSTTSEAIELGFGLLVIRNIPCYKCERCDEILYTGDVARRIEEIVEEAKKAMKEIRVINFADAA